MNKKLDEKEIIGYVKFKGQAVDDGRIEISKFTESVTTFNKLFQANNSLVHGTKYNIEAKVGNIQKGCTDVSIFFDIAVATVSSPLVQTLAYTKVADLIGMTEILKPTFKAVGETIKAKLFTKNEKYKITETENVNGVVYIKVKNIEGKEDSFQDTVFKLAHKMKNLERLAPVVDGQIDAVEVGYRKELREESPIIKVDAGDVEFLKYNPEIVSEDEDKILARVRSVDDKTGNGKLWLDDDKKDWCNFELNIKDINILDKIVKNLALAESKDSLIFIRGEKKFEDKKLTKIIVEDIDIQDDMDSLYLDDV